MTNNHASGLPAAIAAVLRAESAAQNLDYKVIAERSGLSVSTVQRRLSSKGLQRDFKVDQLEKLAGALGLDIVEVVAEARKRLERQTATDRLLANPRLPGEAARQIEAERSKALPEATRGREHGAS